MRHKITPAYATISFTCTRVKFWRCPMVRLYCFLRLNLKTMVLSPRPWAVMVPFTRAALTVEPAFTASPSITARTRSNSTSAPTSPVRVSTSIDSPGATRYCLPPVSITAYILVLVRFGVETLGYYNLGLVRQNDPDGPDGPQLARIHEAGFLK